MNKIFYTFLVILITATIIGGGVYLWQNQVPAPIVETPEVSDEDLRTEEIAEETKENVYQDDYLSFEYPDNMELVQDQVGEGRFMLMLDWLAPAENGNYLQTIGLGGPQLKYPLYLEDEEYASWDALKADKLAVNTDQFAIATELEIAGQEAVLVDGGGFCEHHYELYIQGPVDTTYSLSGNCVNDEKWEALYNTFIETVEFKR
jgi:hypothetical protein